MTIVTVTVGYGVVWSEVARPEAVAERAGDVSRGVCPVCAGDLRHRRRSVNGPRLCAVTAELESPALIDAWWPAPLDGLLAATVDPAELRVAGHSHRNARLPLLRWKRGLNKQWVWAASCAAIDPPAQHSRPGQVLHAGPLRWTAAGDPLALSDMLPKLEQVGGERAAGRGRVASWSVHDMGPHEPADLLAVLWHSDGLISRPVPARAAAVLGLSPSTVDTVPGAVRPPYSIAPRDDRGARNWRAVLAPWTRRPRDAGLKSIA